MYFFSICFSFAVSFPFIYFIHVIHASSVQFHWVQPNMTATSGCLSNCSIITNSSNMHEMVCHLAVWWPSIPNAHVQCFKRMVFPARKYPIYIIVRREKKNIFSKTLGALEHFKLHSGLLLVNAIFTKVLRINSDFTLNEFYMKRLTAIAFCEIEYFVERTNHLKMSATNECIRWHNSERNWFLLTITFTSFIVIVDYEKRLTYFT